MKQVLCSSCGLVNLDKFTTFPFCAACGARLPQNPPSRARAFWTQPIKPIFWVSCVGLGVAILGLGAIYVARETRDRTEQMMVVYAQLPRKVAPDGAIYLGFSLDSTSENAVPEFEQVQLRVPSAVFKSAKLLSISPAPHSSFKRVSGHYFEWETLARDTPIRMALRPTQSGALRFPVSIYATDFQMFSVRVNLPIHPRDLKAANLAN